MFQCMCLGAAGLTLHGELGSRLKKILGKYTYASLSLYLCLAEVPLMARDDFERTLLTSR